VAPAVNRAAARAFFHAQAESTAVPETPMIKSILCLSLIAATGFAYAATGDDNGDREARRAEWQARAEAKFAEADADRDGSLDRVEAAAFGERFVARFDRIDADSNGELSKDEMRKAQRMHRRGGRGHGMSYMAGMFKGMDDDGNGAISRAELGTKAPMLADNFVAIDLDRNGELSQEELRAHHRAKRAEHRASGEGGEGRRGHRGHGERAGHDGAAPKAD
jgi:hypothetical protein